MGRLIPESTPGRSRAKQDHRHPHPEVASDVLVNAVQNFSAAPQGVTGTLRLLRMTHRIVPPPEPSQLIEGRSNAARHPAIEVPTSGPGAIEASPNDPVGKHRLRAEVPRNRSGTITK